MKSVQDHREANRTKRKQASRDGRYWDGVEKLDKTEPKRRKEGQKWRNGQRTEE